MGPQLHTLHPHDRATTVLPQACSLLPGTGSETPSPGTSRQGRDPSLTRVPANAGRDLVIISLILVLSGNPSPPNCWAVVSESKSSGLPFPTATAHGAENVTRLQLGKYRPWLVVVVDSRWRRGFNSTTHTHKCTASSAAAQPNLRDKVSTTDELLSPPVVYLMCSGLSKMFIFNIFFSFYLACVTREGGNQTCCCCVCVVMGNIET